MWSVLSVLDMSSLLRYPQGSGFVLLYEDASPQMRGKSCMQSPHMRNPRMPNTYESVGRSRRVVHKVIHRLTRSQFHKPGNF